MLVRLLLSPKAVSRRRRLVDALEPSAFVTVVAGGETVLEAIDREVVDLAVLDVRDLGEDPCASIAALRAAPEAPEIVVLERAGVPWDRAAALAAGCLAAIDGGLELSSLAAALVGICDRLSGSQITSAPSLGSRFDNRLEALGTRSDAIRRLHREARSAAQSDAPVLIEGEPGAGRAVLGPALHLESPRSAGPFRSLQCAGMGEEEFASAFFGHEAQVLAGSTRAMRGACEEAHRGTLFLENLDEAGQATVARFLDDGTVRPVGGEKEIPVRVRILMSIPLPDPTDQRPQLIPELRGRAGLQTLSLPSLRERPDDLPDLARNVLDRLNVRHGLNVQGLEPSAMKAIEEHSWPGNLAELWSVIERASLVARDGLIECDDLPSDLTDSAGGDAPSSKLRIEADWLVDASRLPTLRELRERSLEVVERAYLEEVLRASGGRIDESARRADIDPRSLRARMRNFGLRKEDFKVARRAGGDAD